MSLVPIQKLRAGEGIPPLDEISRTFDAIRRRAYELFEERGAAAGSELENWLDAERELAWIPPAEMTESDTEFAIRVAAPGFEAAELAITATPEALVIEGSKKNRTEKKGDHLVVTENRGALPVPALRLPQPIDVEKVTAALTQGEVSITAPKGEMQAGKDRHRGVSERRRP